MKRCSLCEWIPILPWPVWPLAWQCSLGQNTVVGSMTLLLAVRGNIATRSMSGPPFALQLHYTTIWCGATVWRKPGNIQTMAASFHRAAFPERLSTGILNPPHPTMESHHERLRCDYPLDAAARL